jgi:hypothetical protein
MIPCCAVWLLPAAMQVQSVRFTDLRYFVSQFHYAFSDGILHDDRLAPQTRWIAVARLSFQSLTGSRARNRSLATSKCAGRKRYARSSLCLPESGMAQPPP